MLKYLIAIVILLFAVVGGIYAYFSRNIFIDFNPNAPVSAEFRTEGREILHRQPDGTYTPLQLRGVEFSPFFPGYMVRDFGADFYDYLRWFGYIEAMGANTVYVQTKMDPDFYSALHTFNTTNEGQLFILQGVPGYDYDSLTTNLRQTIAAIHGRRIDFFGGIGIDAYLTDVSSWVVGIIVGAEWDPDMVTFMNHFESDLPDYFEGEFFSSAEGASRFEVMLANVMNTAVDYETRRYNTQRPIGFISDPSLDFLEYSPAYAAQLRKYVQLDPENILPSDRMIAGTFAAYRLFYFADDFTSLLTPRQRRELAPILENLDRSCFADGYLDLLAQYHTMPIIAAGFGFSSSRTTHIMDRYPLTEREQGEALVNMITQIEERGWAGSIISSWQDTWERRTWNTAFSSDPRFYHYWHNLQSVDQGYGLLTFEPGAYERPVIIGRGANQWTDNHRVHEYGGISIYAQYTFQGLYLMIRGYGVGPQNDLYLPIYVTPRSGIYSYYDFEFSRPSDFLLILSGTENSRLLVSERYNSTFLRFHEEMTGVNPFTLVPPRWDSEFTPITLAVQNTLVIDAGQYRFRYRQQIAELLRLRYWEAGNLTHGTGDPTSPDFNSLSDFHFGENLVEVRLPWTLINFFDPSNMRVHDDYFDNFGVEGLSVNRIYIGIATESGAAPMSPIPLSGWRGWTVNLQFHERLKQSYFVVQELWRGAN